MDKIKLPHSTPFLCTIPCRISDLNYGKHIGHVQYIDILHEARIQFLQSLGGGEADFEGKHLLVTGLQVSYLEEGFYPDSLEVSVYLGEKTRTRIEFIYCVYSTKQKKSLIHAITECVFIEKNTKKISRLPSALCGLN